MVKRSAKFENVISEADIQLSENIQSYPTFASMGLNTHLLRGIYSYGFETPSLIQQKTIKQIISGRDVIAQAQNGTGKTATFSIGTLENINPESNHVQVLIVAPTRELALQIHQVVSSLSDYMSIKCVACCGGRCNTGKMAVELEKGAQVVVGTPGRILELIRQGSLRLNHLRSFVLDEADEMLNSGLRNQLADIYRHLPSRDNLNESAKCQVVIVSATLPKDHLETFENFTSDPIRILVPRDELSLSGLKQFYINVGSEEWKFEALGDLFASVCVPQTVVFVNTRRKVDWLHNQLKHEGFAVSAVHGELDQTQREVVMDRFRSGESRILVSSDVWARGIDVQTVGLVVNYDLPSTPTEYLHRIGRSGRFGRRGLAVTLIASPDESKQLKDYALYFQILIPPAPARLDKMLVFDEPDQIKTDSTSAAKQSSDDPKRKKKKRRKKNKNKKPDVDIDLPKSS